MLLTTFLLLTSPLESGIADLTGDHPHTGIVDPGGPGERAGTAVLFLNYEGAYLSSGSDDARNNRSQFCSGQYPAYGNDQQKKDAVTQAVREDFSPFTLEIVDQRPAGGSYTMAMIGPSNCIGGDAVGYAPVDCWDQNPNNVVFSFASSSSSLGINAQAAIVGQEMGHALGLEHVDKPQDVMNPTVGAGDQWFIDDCYPLTGNLYCNSQHAQFCSGGYQNSYAELADLLGVLPPDVQSPTVEIVEPMDGAVFGAGSSFDIVADAWDDVGVTTARLYVDGVYTAQQKTPPFAWPVQKIPVGVYEFQVVVEDAAGNDAASDTVVVTVNDGPPSTTTGEPEPTGSSSGTTTTGGEPPPDTATTGDPTTTWMPDGELEEGRGDGCSCRAAPRGLPTWLVVLLPLARRRRA